MLKVIPDEVVECGYFDDEYVYDIEMSNTTNHTFFANDILVHNSCYVSLSELLQNYRIPFFDESGEKVNPKVVKLCDGIERALNKRLKDWGETTLNSIDCRFQFKMEAIADKAFFIAKKNYILHILNDEGFDVEKEEKRWKYKGVKLVSAGMPEKVKPLVKEVVHNMIMSSDQDKTDEIYNESYQKYLDLDDKDIALIKSLNKFDKYVQECSGWNPAPRMSAHYRGGYYYNKLIDILDLGSKYTKITQSDKVKYLYLNPNNKYGINVISYIDNYPKEFEELFEIDKMLMFEKSVKDLVKQFYDALGWNILSPNKQAKINIRNEFLI